MFIDDFQKIIVENFKKEYPIYNYPTLSEEDRELYRRVNMKKLTELSIESHILGISLDCLAQDIIKELNE